MAMLASKTPYPSSMGMGSNQASSSNQYSNTLATHRTPVIGSSHNGPFASPTESEFSDGAYESPETAVRSVLPLIVANLFPCSKRIMLPANAARFLDPGTRGESANGYGASTVPSMSTFSSVCAHHCP